MNTASLEKTIFMAAIMIATAIWFGACGIETAIRDSKTNVSDINQNLNDIESAIRFK